MIQRLDDSEEGCLIQVDSFKEFVETLMVDQRSTTIAELSVLELGLITAVKKLIIIRRDAKTFNPLFNFEMVYDEYQKFVLYHSRQGHHTGSLHFAKPVALKV